jgi:tape measure domain-containing protein
MEGGDLCMSGIDTRVAQIRFDNAQFEAGIRTSLASLAKLNAGLKLEGASKGLSDVSKAASHFSLGNIASSVGNISSKFSAMSVIGITALASLTAAGVRAGAALVKSLTIQPLTSGFAEYETGLNSVQTILANTQAAGVGLKEVNATLLDLNKYSDQTIYNFSQMAKNIGTFTAAGVDLKTATASIKGIANLAALSGSNSEQASSAMYQLSQAISAGRVSLEDWNSVVNAGMGGTVFQRALAQNAEKMGTLSKGAVELKGKMKNVTIEGKSFRESITAKPGEKSWLTSDVLTRTLSQFTGDLSNAALAAQGFNEQEIKAIQAQAKTAKNAATQVKTMTQLFGTLKEAAGSGWAQTWQLIFGDFDEAKKLFTSVNNTLGGFISASSNARNKVIGDWKAMGGRTVLIEAIGNAFKALISFVTPIKNAFREIFPAATGKTLYDLSVSLRNFTQGLILGADTADKLKRTFAGVFAIFGIGVEVIKQVIGMVLNLFGAVGKSSSGFLDVTASMGDWLVALHEALVNGEGIAKFFQGFGRILSYPIKALKILAQLIASAFGSDSPGLANLQERFAPLGALGNVVAAAWSKAVGILDNVWSTFQQLAPQLSDAFTTLMDNIMEAFSGGNYNKILDGINTGLFAALVLAFRKFTKGSLFGDVNVGEGFFGSITGAFDQLTGTMKAMQSQLKAGTLLKIAAAIALLTVSVVALSMIDSEKLTRALTALTIMFGQLLVGMALFAKATAGAGLVRLPVMAAGLILVAIAIDILVVAVTALSKLSWEDLAKGLGGTIVLLGALVGVVRGMAGQSAGMVTAGAGLILIAAALKILVSAVTDLSGLSWEEMAQGLTGTAVLLASLALFSKFAGANAGGVLGGAGIILLAAGIKILASALKDISQLSWEELGQGLAGMAGGLVLIGAALMLIPPSSLLSAAAVLIVAASLGMLADALGQMGGMTWEEIAKGLTVLAVSLGVIAAAMILMTTALPGAAALFIITASLRLFVPVLQTLGTMSWGEIAKGLLTLAAAFAVIGIAGLLLTPVVPTLIGLGIAITLLGIGMLAAGGGILAFSLALTALSVAGAAGAAAVVGIVTALIGLIPKVMEGIAKGIEAFAKTLATAAPAMFKSMSIVISSMLDAIVKLAPKIIGSLLTLISQFLSKLAAATPKLVSAGFRMLQGLLTGIANNIGKVVTTATTIIVNFLNGISRNQGRIIDSGVKLIISFINGMASAIRGNSAALGKAGANLATAIIQGMAQGLAAGVGQIAQQAANVAKSALNAAKNALGIHSPSKEFEKIGKFVIDGFVKGMQGTSRQGIIDAFNTLRTMVSDAVASSAADMKTAKERLDKLTSAHHKNAKAIKAARLELAQATSEHKKALATRKLMYGSMVKERERLKDLASQYDKNNEKLEKANQVLADAKKTRDDFAASVKTQFSDLPEISGDTKLADYVDDLKEQIVKTKAFAAVLQKLRTLGLNDTLYKELLSKGVDALPFVTQLLDSGKRGVDELNGLDKTLEETAGKLGNTASTTLYQAAVDSAAGLVRGLQLQQKAIEKVMEAIGNAMVKSIKKQLGIKSPSKAFEEVGQFSAEGLARGLTNASTAVKRSAEGVGKDAILALRKSISDMSDMGVGNMDLTPTIRPVLDLSAVKREAGNMSAMIPKQIDVGTAYSQARGAMHAWEANQSAKTDPQVRTELVRDVTFVQNNTSPKAISAADTYRQTKNQLSVAKGALTK